MLQEPNSQKRIADARGNAIPIAGSATRVAKKAAASRWIK